MFKVFIDYNIFEDKVLEWDESNTWYQILSRQRSIYVNHNVDAEDFYNPDNPLFVFSQMTNTAFVDESNYISNVLENNEQVLENPCSAFILDIAPQKADEIQKKFGVICQSKDNMKTAELTLDDTTINTSTGGSWTERVPYGQVLPSNSLIIMDRYLFSSEEGESIDDSYENIIDMINAFTPNYFANEYHICIIFDISRIQDRDIQHLLNSEKSTDFTEDDIKASFCKISTQLNKEKQELVKAKNYNITLEIITVDNRDKDIYKKTHDRKVISNFFYATASHKLKAYRNRNPLVRQKIDVLPLYAKGFDNVSDIPEETHAEDINDLRFILNESKRHPQLHYYSINGNTNLSIQNAKNRILI